MFSKIGETDYIVLRCKNIGVTMNELGKDYLNVCNNTWDDWVKKGWMVNEHGLNTKMND